MNYRAMPTETDIVGLILASVIAVVVTLAVSLTVNWMYRRIK